MGLNNILEDGNVAGRFVGRNHPKQAEACFWVVIKINEWVFRSYIRDSLDSTHKRTSLML